MTNAKQWVHIMHNSPIETWLDQWSVAGWICVWLWSGHPKQRLFYREKEQGRLMCIMYIGLIEREGREENKKGVHVVAPVCLSHSHSSMEEGWIRQSSWNRRRGHMFRAEFESNPRRNVRNLTRLWFSLIVATQTNHPRVIHFFPPQKFVYYYPTRCRHSQYHSRRTLKLAPVLPGLAGRCREGNNIAQKEWNVSFVKTSVFRDFSACHSSRTVNPISVKLSLNQTRL